MAQKNQIGENGGERKINPSANPGDVLESVTNQMTGASFLNFCLFVLLLYFPSQQLWSLRDGQLT